MRTVRTTIRRKLVAGMMLTSMAVLVLTGAALVVFDIVSFRRALVRALVTRAQILAANSSGALAFENPDDASQILAALKPDPSMVGAALYDRQGRVLAAYPVPAAAPARWPRKTGSGQRFEKKWLVVDQPVLEEGRWLGTLYLKSDLRALDERLRLYALVVALALVGSSGVALALAAWLQRGIARPVRALAEAARNVSEHKDYTIRAHVVSDDELGLLAESFNEMLREIEKRDVDLRQLNADLEWRVNARTAQLEAANHELEAFSYSVSHDLRAPLRHVDGFADLLQRHARESLDDKARHYLAQISDSAQSMGRLIDDLLVFSRMGRTEMQDQRVDLNVLVEEARRVLANEAANRDIHWRVSPLPETRGDPAMLQLVFANLVSNAIKYTAGRAGAEIAIGAEQSDRETVVCVRDNGVGFDMNYSHKLFGVFQRLHSADEFEGTGIGLANVRRIVQRHGGRTWAEGEVGRGAAFFFSLPRETQGEWSERKEAA